MSYLRIRVHLNCPCFSAGHSYILSLIFPIHLLPAPSKTPRTPSPGKLILLSPPHRVHPSKALSDSCSCTLWIRCLSSTLSQSHAYISFPTKFWTAGCNTCVLLTYVLRDQNIVCDYPALEKVNWWINKWKTSKPKRIINAWEREWENNSSQWITEVCVEIVEVLLSRPETFPTFINVSELLRTGSQETKIQLKVV